MSLREGICHLHQLVFPAWKGYPYQAEYAQLATLQWRSLPEIRDWQRLRLTQALDFWRADIPYYRDHLNREAARLGRCVDELCREMVETLELRHLPIMSKALFMDNHQSLQNPQMDRRLLRLNHTGGSTGTVFHFYQNHLDSRWSNATNRLHREFIGQPLGVSTAKVWGASLEAHAATDLKERLQHWLLNTTFISTYDLSRERVARTADLLLRANPRLLIGYPTSLGVISAELAARGLRQSRLQAVWSASETLFPAVREQLEREFLAPVYNNYGSREFGGLAMECTQRRGLHLNEGCYLFEFKPVADGLHSLLVTDLHNRAQPLVRYEIGDLVRLSEETCPCGRGHTLIRHVEGRTFDLIRGQDGEAVTGTFWTLLLRSRPGIRQFQVVQRQLDDFEIRLVAGPEFRRESCDYFADKIQSQFSRPVKVEWTFHEGLESLPSGKFKFIVALPAPPATAVPPPI
jgi:phenylacetate-CoA ligase